MTRNEALFLSAYTGVLLVPKFSDLHGYMEEKLGGAIFTHQLGAAREEFKIRFKPELMEIMKSVEESSD